MKWWLVTVGESKGYDSYPVERRYFVAANTEGEVRLLLTRVTDLGDTIEDIRLFPEFPSLERKRKPFIFNPTPDVYVF